MGGAFPAFDLDLQYGQSGEVFVEDLVRDTLHGKIEVKTDRRWQDTGNLFIETECWSIRQQCFTPSGINTSESDFYAFVLPVGERTPMVAYFPTKLVKLVVEELGRPIEQNWSENPSKGYLITLEDMYSYARRVR